MSPGRPRKFHCPLHWPKSRTCAACWAERMRRQREQQRDYNTAYQAQRRIVAHELGLCSQCCSRDARPGYNTCLVCQGKGREDRQRKAAARAAVRAKPQ